MNNNKLLVINSSLHMNTKFNEIFILGKKQSIDEAMIPFKRRLSMKLYMPKKQFLVDLKSG